MNHVKLSDEVAASTFLASLHISSDKDYENRLDYVETLMDRADAGDDLVLPLLDYVSKLIEEYEEVRYPIDSPSPGRMLAFYMVDQVKRLAEKYNTNPSVFI